VNEKSQKTLCFTHSYGKYLKGTGSVYQISEKMKVFWCEENNKKRKVEK